MASITQGFKGPGETPTLKSLSTPSKPVPLALQPVQRDQSLLVTRPLTQMMSVDPGFTSPASLPLLGFQQNAALKMLTYAKPQTPAKPCPPAPPKPEPKKEDEGNIFQQMIRGAGHLVGDGFRAVSDGAGWVAGEAVKNNPVALVSRGLSAGADALGQKDAANWLSGADKMSGGLGEVVHSGVRGVGEFGASTVEGVTEVVADPITTAKGLGIAATSAVGAVPVLGDITTGIEAGLRGTSQQAIKQEKSENLGRIWEGLQADYNEDVEKIGRTGANVKVGLDVLTIVQGAVGKGGKAAKIGQMAEEAAAPAKVAKATEAFHFNSAGQGELFGAAEKAAATGKPAVQAAEVAKSAEVATHLAETRTSIPGLSGASTKADLADASTKVDLANASTRVDLGDASTKVDLGDASTKVDLADASTLYDARTPVLMPAARPAPVVVAPAPTPVKPWAPWPANWNQMNAALAKEGDVLTSAKSSAAAKSQAAETIEKALVDPNAKVVFSHKIGEGISHSETVQFDNGVKAVWKRDGAARSVTSDTHMRHINQANSSGNEVAAYLVDKAMGHPAGVPPTVLHQDGGVSGTLQFFKGDTRRPWDFQPGTALDNAHNQSLPFKGSMDGNRSVNILDNVIGNVDRHRGNWLDTKRGDTLPIDHGLAFPEKNAPQGIHNSKFFTDTIQLNDAEKSALQGLITRREELTSQLTPLIGDKSVQTMYERIESMLQKGETYGSWRD